MSAKKTVDDEALSIQWKKAAKSHTFIIQLGVTLALLTMVAVTVGYFFIYIQSRPGYLLDDPLLNRIPARDMSNYIFGLIYCAILAACFYFIRYPVLFLKILQAYFFLTMMRSVTLFFVALEPDKSIIPLEDPVVNRWFYNNVVITKDLFFSGHVSVLFLFFLVAPSRNFKYFFLGITLLVAAFILLQHVHYTVDVLAAFLFFMA